MVFGTLKKSLVVILLAVGFTQQASAWRFNHPPVLYYSPAPTVVIVQDRPLSHAALELFFQSCSIILEHAENPQEFFAALGMLTASSVGLYCLYEAFCPHAKRPKKKKVYVPVATHVSTVYETIEISEPDVLLVY